jgi:hypothetical protein
MHRAGPPATVDDVGGKRVDLVRCPRPCDHVRAGVRQGQGEVPADPSTGPGNQSNPISQLERRVGRSRNGELTARLPSPT